MKLILPPGVSAAQFDAALRGFRSVVGDAYVFATDEDRDTYLDPYAPGQPETYAASGGVAPTTVEEIQALLKIANQYKVPLWPISRGKNFGYGTAAPAMSGTFVLDLARMNRILEVNVDMGYVVLEPGVGFNDLFKYLQDNKIPLWMSAAAQTWGSVVGNALERGVGYTPYGDHANRVCGMEIVLANGRVVRTGMGAMPGGEAWQLFKHGFGPSWESAFMQSNFGVVTKMGLWMQPAPQSTTSLSMSLPKEDDLGPAIDALRPLKLAGVVQANPSFANMVRTMASRYQRTELYQGDGPIPNDVLDQLRVKTGSGWWTFQVRLFELPEVNEIHAKVIRDAFAKVTPVEFKTEIWNRGDPIEKSGEAIPSLAPLNVVNWRGGRGGHLTFSPISAPRGSEAMKQYRMLRKRYEEYGFDYYGGFTAGERYLNHITMIIYDRDNPDMTHKARELFKVIVKDSADAGYGEYRTHVAFADDVANSYSWGNRALMHLNESVKDALDPNGILAPGKQGVWPARRERPTHEVDALPCRRPGAVLGGGRRCAGRAGVRAHRAAGGDNSAVAFGAADALASSRSRPVRRQLRLLSRSQGARHGPAGQAAWRRPWIAGSPDRSGAGLCAVRGSTRGRQHALVSQSRTAGLGPRRRGRLSDPEASQVRPSMWDRRDFIKTSAAAAAGAALVSPALASANILPGSGQISAVIFDPRFSDSRAFAETLMARGARGFSTAEDIGRLWNGPLAEAFAAAPGALAGLTPHTDLFISQVFAGQVTRGRLVFEAMHDSRGGALLVHTLDMAPSERGLADEIAASGEAWPVRLAERLDAMTSRAAPSLREAAQSQAVADDHPGTLFSWVIARAAG